MSNNNLEEVDWLSQLPEPLLLQILSFLPTKFAVRTSLLARRFRHLWTVSPSMELDRSDFPPGRLFNDVISRCLRLRDPSAPLRSFCLKTTNNHRPFSVKLLSNWLTRAYSLGLRDLSLHIHTDTTESLLPLILSFGSLHSLCINGVDFDPCNINFNIPFPHLVPTTFPLTQLKYLSIKAKYSYPDLKTFIMEQRNLEYLCIEPAPCREPILDLSSQSVKKLSFRFTFQIKTYLSFPKLEFLDLNIRLFVKPNIFYGEMPVLRKALIETGCSLREECVPALRDILKSITNVSDLTLHIGTPCPKEIPGATRGRKLGYKGKLILNGFDLFHPFVEPGKDMLMFPNLRSLKLSMCFYENALQDLICLLHHSPVIDSLHLIHERMLDYQRTCWAPEVWQSKLPLNSEGNRKYADFSNLQTGDKKSEAIKLLSSEDSSKRLKT
ncbi:F-box/LRR-repeat protein At4g14103-like isoform X2 [Carex rostrata]